MTLVLCTGCRIGVCVETKGYGGGCFGWDGKILKEDFVFYCPFCASATDDPCKVLIGLFGIRTLSHLIRSQLIPRTGVTIPAKSTVWFRYDPPTLIVAITWHGTQAKFGRFFHERLALSYYNKAEWVSRPPKLVFLWY